MPTFKLTIAYDGTGLVGWQRQPAGTSVQGLLEEALAALDGRPVAALGASRTDAGVHAAGQVAGVAIDRAIDGRSLAHALNARLPGAVRVLEAVEVDPAFHARFDARAKTYRYRIWNGSVVPPFERPYTWHVPAALDLDAMAAAAALFDGAHDFAAFQAAGASTSTTRRVVFSSRVARDDGPWGARAGLVSPSVAGGAPPAGGLIVFEIRGDGFLRHMVRAMAGTLVEIGRGYRDAQWAAHLLASGDRSALGRTAPPAGLFLVGVEYE